MPLSKSQWYDLQFLWYRAKQTAIGKFRSFFALYPPLKTPKIKILKKWKKLLEMISPAKIRIIWCTVPEIQSENRQNFLSFSTFFCPFTSPLMILNIKILKKMKKMPGHFILLYIHVYHKSRSYDIWFLKHKVW